MGMILYHFRCCLSLVFFFPQAQSRQQGGASKVRATVAPFPLSSSSGSRGPPPPKASRPALTLREGGGTRRQAPVMQESDDEDEISTAIQ